jgi:MOSC domain-containing protein YiiM
VLQITAPRIPCWKPAKRMEDPRFVKRFAAAGRPGAYFRIVEEGELGAGDPIEVLERPDHDVTVGLVSHAYLFDHDEAERLLAAPALAATWRDWAGQHTRVN